MAGNFDANTRMKRLIQPAQVRPAGGGITRLELPRFGLLSKVFIRISATVAGGVGGVPNVLGAGSIIRRIRLVANSGLELFSCSGIGWSYIIQHMLESEYAPVTPQNQGRSPVANATFNLDVVIPVAVSSLDLKGIVLLQSEQVLLTLEIEWESDAIVWAGGGGALAITGTAVPTLETFSVPASIDNAPNLSQAHMILEETRVIPGAGQMIYEPLRRPTYLQLAHASGILAAGGADNITTARLRVEGSNYLFDGNVAALDLIWNYEKNYARVPGVWMYDLMGSSGLGNFSGYRDRINTSTLTAFESEFNAIAGGTLWTVRRMLVELSR